MEGISDDGQEARRPGDDRRRGVHGPVRSLARVHARSRRVSGSGAEEGAESGTVGGNAQSRDFGGARHYERAVSGEADGAGSGGAAGGRRRRSRENAAAGETQGSRLTNTVPSREGTSWR